MVKQAGHYSTFDVIDLFNFKRGRFKNWIEQGFITPTYQEEFDSGLKRSYFDRRGLYMVKLFEIFLEIGLKREHAARWLQEFEKANIQNPRFIAIRFQKNDAPEIKLREKQSGMLCGDLTLQGIGEFDYCHVIDFGKIVSFVNDVLDHS